MRFKSGFIRCFFLSLMILFVGCAELKSLQGRKNSNDSKNRRDCKVKEMI